VALKKIKKELKMINKVLTFLKKLVNDNSFGRYEVGLLVIAFLGRGLFLFNRWFGISEYEFLLINQKGIFAPLCHSRGDCFLPASLLLINLPRHLLRIGGTIDVFYWERIMMLTLGMISLFSLWKIASILFPKQQLLQRLFLAVLAINPQFVFVNRFITPIGIAFSLAGLGSWLLLEGGKNERKRGWIAAGLLVLLMAMFSSLQAFLVVWLILLLITAGLKSKKVDVKTLVGVLAGSMFLWLFYLYSHHLLTIRRIMPFLEDPGVINAINASRGTEINFGIPKLARILFNKGYYLIFWLARYWRQFSLSNIFSLVENSQSSLIIAAPPMLLFFAPFFVIGLFNSFRLMSRGKSWGLLAITLVLAIPTSFYQNFFHQDLFVFALLPISFYVALGLKLMEKKKAWKWFLASLLVVNVVISYYKINRDFFRSNRLINQELYQQLESND